MTKTTSEHHKNFKKRTTKKEPSEKSNNIENSLIDGLSKNGWHIITFDK